MQPNYHVIGMDHGHLELALTLRPDNVGYKKFHRKLVCDVYLSGMNCNSCGVNKTLSADLSIDKDGQDFCLEKTATTLSDSEHEPQDKNTMTELTIKCHIKPNKSCDTVCLHLYNSNNQQGAASLQEFDKYDTPAGVQIKSTYKALVEDVYTQSLTVVDDNIYTAAMEQCEAHKDEHCHWIPNSVITKHHCGDCQPICRSVRHSLNFVQFSIGAFWFMFSMPVAEVSLPLVISDSLREEFQVCANTILHVYTLDHTNIHITAQCHTIICFVVSC